MIRFKRMSPDVRAPHRIHDYDAAFDVYANETQTLSSRASHKFGTGLILSVPIGSVIMVLSRSGLATDHGVVVVNAPGLVDPGYRGELGVSLMNLGPNPYRVERGDRIAQLIVVNYMQADVMEGELHDPPDARGTGGFGSTGR